MKMVLMAALGGALGSSGRYLVNMATLRLFGAGFPWGTICVNIIGSFLMGVLIESLALRYNASEATRIFLATGFLGGFTTFSAFSLDVIALFERKQFLASTLYLTASVFFSVLALYAGLSLIRALYQ